MRDWAALSWNIELSCDFAHGLQIQRMFPIGQSKETLWGKDFEVGFIGGNSLNSRGPLKVQVVEAKNVKFGS
ncbi:MAG: hypothetical protein CL676_07720 [Bdellovibrionaceae bacterium]|nr:hypothetical protein [Pseudobdellovibrionaceae bacterium]